MSTPVDVFCCTSRSWQWHLSEGSDRKTGMAIGRFASHLAPLIVFLANTRAPDTPAGQGMAVSMPRLTSPCPVARRFGYTRPQTPLCAPDALKDGKPYGEQAGRACKAFTGRPGALSYGLIGPGRSPPRQTAPVVTTLPCSTNHRLGLTCLRPTASRREGGGCQPCQPDLPLKRRGREKSRKSG